LDEIYGAPYGNTPVSPATGVEPVNGVDHIAEYWNGSTSVSGVPCPEYCPTWVGPALDGRWHQVTVHVVINSDGSGSTQVYFDGVLQTLANGSTTDSYQVLQSGNNWNGGSSGDYIISDEYYSSSEPSPGPIYHGYQAIGSTLASVEPPTGWGTP
jgi:hypothetical protein